MDAGRWALTSLAGTFSMLACASAFSQQPASSEEAAGKAMRVERVEVTGTRLPPPNLEGSSPVIYLNSEDIRQEGALPIEEILARLPPILGGQNSMAANGASGTATIDLRGLGPIRTLVLMNGRRLGPGQPLNSASDLNQVPTALIRRVDVLTGGASAVYGSDAIAGVVNFVMNKRFEGVQGDLTYGFFNHQQQNPQGVADIVAARAVTNPTQFKVPGDKKADGESLVASLVLGGNFAGGKGNATVYFGYRDDKALLESERDYSACALIAGASGFSCGGSITSYPGLFLVDPVRDGRLLTVADSSGGVRSWQAATDVFNFGPTNYYRRPTERYGFSAFADYAITQDATLYTELGFHDDRTVAQIAESGLFGLPVTVSYGNPLLSGDWRRQLRLANPGDTVPVLIYRRNVEGGARQFNLGHTSHREVIGVKGTLGEHWSYDAFFQTSEVLASLVQQYDFLKTRGIRAMDVVASPATGRPVCRSVLDGSDPNCVPYNIWTLGGVTQEALDYLQGPGVQNGDVLQRILGATVSTDLGSYGIRVPGMRDGVAVSIGVERRNEEQTRVSDVNLSTADLAGQISAAPSMSGSYSVNEIFGEARMPILDSLSANVTYRYSSYSTGKRTNSFGAGFDFSPDARARLRGSIQRAVRVADIVELFTPQEVVNGFLADDPCDGPTPSRSFEECARTGVTRAQYGHIIQNPVNNGNVNVRIGGNPGLEPETGNTATLGIVLTPTRDFSATVDYFDIRIEDTIGAAGPITFSQCLNTGDPLFCDRIRRDPEWGTLWLPGSELDNTLNNLGKLRTSGLDVGINYRHRLEGMGNIAVNGLGTYMREFIIEPYRGYGSYDCAGYFAYTCYLPRPKWRHRLSATWSTPWTLSLTATWRYFREVFNSRTSSNPLLSSTIPVPEVVRKLPAMNYLDLAVSWAIDRRFTLRGGVSNALDRDPPLSDGGPPPLLNGNTWVGTYDPLGRRIWLTLTATF